MPVSAWRCGTIPVTDKDRENVIKAINLLRAHPTQLDAERVKAADEQATKLAAEEAETLKAPVFRPCHCGMMQGECTL